MNMEELFEVVDEYSHATQMPVSCFVERRIIKRTMDFLTDFNLPMLLLDCLPQELPQTWYCITPEFMYMTGLTVPEANMTIFIGPALTFECSREQASRILERIGRSREDVSKLIQFFRAIGSCDAASIQSGVRLLQRLLFDSCSTPVQLEFHWKRMPYFPAYCIPEPENSEEVPFENELVKYMENGRSDLVESLILNEILAGKGEDPKDPQLFQNRYGIICSANFFCSRIALRANLDISLVTALFAQYDRQIHQASSVSELTYIFVAFIREYTRQIAAVKKLQTKSPIAKRVNNYVVSHIYETITPTLLSEKLNVSLSYLCREFKKATGKTVSFFVQERKVEEAMHLLKQNTLSVISISQILGFSSLSYFGVVFKKHTGMTPTEYQCKET